MYLGWLSSGPPSSSWSGPGAGTMTHSAKASFFSCHGCLGSNLMQGLWKKIIDFAYVWQWTSHLAVHKKIQEQNQASQLLDNTAKWTSRLPFVNKNQWTHQSRQLLNFISATFNDQGRLCKGLLSPFGLLLGPHRAALMIILILLKHMCFLLQHFSFHS